MKGRDIGEDDYGNLARYIDSHGGGVAACPPIVPEELLPSF